VEDPEGRPLPGIQVFPAADAGYSTFGRTCRTDAEGRFRLYGNWMTPDVRVCTSSYDWLRRESGGVVVPAGSTGNRIVCTRAARIEVTLEVDARFENAPFDFRLGSADDDRRWLVLVRWRDRRHAVITTDATGTVDLEVLGLRDGPVLATVGGIAVEPGQTVEREIDLRGKLLAYAFHLTDGKAGIRSSRAEFRFVYEGKPGLRALNADFSDGFLRFLAPTPEVEISVRLEGYRTLVRKVTPADREIALEPVFRVEFRLDPTAAAPTEHLRLVPVLTPLDGEGEAHPIDLGSAWYYKGAYWAPHGLVVRAGRYRVAYHLRPASGKGAGVAIGHVEPSEIEVKDRPTTQTFPVRITWRDLAAAQAGLR
jgi:hypothetical protein